VGFRCYSKKDLCILLNRFLLEYHLNHTMNWSILFRSLSCLKSAFMCDSKLCAIDFVSCWWQSSIECCLLNDGSMTRPCLSLIAFFIVIYVGSQWKSQFWRTNSRSSEINYERCRCTYQCCYISTKRTGIERHRKWIEQKNMNRLKLVMNIFCLVYCRMKYIKKCMMKSIEE
jgi:hypothetical protein